MCGSKYPDFAWAIIEPMILTVDEVKEQDRLWTAAFGIFQGRSDLAASVRMAQARMWEQKGEATPVVPVLPALPPVPKQPEPPRSTGGVAAGKPIPDRRKPGEKPPAPKGKAALDLEKLVSLYQAGILTEQEFESAKKRVMEKW